MSWAEGPMNVTVVGKKNDIPSGEVTALPTTTQMTGAGLARLNVTVQQGHRARVHTIHTKATGLAQGIRSLR